MTSNLHDPHSDGRQPVRNKAVSDDSGDGSRRGGRKNPAAHSSDGEAEDQSTIEAFEEEGAGIAAKE
jgi:hypothetical protein